MVTLNTGNINKYYDAQWSLIIIRGMHISQNSEEKLELAEGKGD